ncbi:hypothetical protein [Umezawaea sp. Da 62-37]|uniref:hypothetical protein n=1 Tax=Umezawaea sp. Da 62-37 TaxID=3075927 RepID=UPI0028F71668|nr:hypothetical protein [Umezawaea sp. Da 62-37]WNV89506.1 hypothetical protein RM788_14750 [Umezawaea sp. Da 62-37]
MRTTLVIALFLLVTGCSAEPAPVRSNGGSDADARHAYSRCMREHGSEQPEQPADGKLGTAVLIPADDAAAVRAEEQAFEACRKLLSNGGTPEETDAAQADKDRETSKCLTGKGFPGDGGAQYDPRGQEFQDALRECSR